MAKKRRVLSGPPPIKDAPAEPDLRQIWGDSYDRIAAIRPSGHPARDHLDEIAFDLDFIPSDLKDEVKAEFRVKSLWKELKTAKRAYKPYKRKVRTLSVRRRGAPSKLTPDDLQPVLLKHGENRSAELLVRMLRVERGIKASKATVNRVRRRLKSKTRS